MELKYSDSIIEITLPNTSLYHAQFRNGLLAKIETRRLPEIDIVSVNPHKNSAHTTIKITSKHKNRRDFWRGYFCAILDMS